MWKHVYLCCYQSCKLRHQSFFNDVCASFINGLTPVFHQSTGTGLHCVSWWLLNVSELLIIEGTGEINKTAFLIDLIAALSIFCETMCILSTIGYKTHKQYHWFISLNVRQKIQFIIFDLFFTHIPFKCEIQDCVQKYLVVGQC